MIILLSVLPILLLIVLMLGFRLRGDWSAALSLLISLFLAAWVLPNLGLAPIISNSYHGGGLLSPQLIACWAVVEGTFKAIFPILIIILMALYSYNVLVKSKQIEFIKTQFASISTDKSVQVLLVVWGFGGLLEGMAGFGSAVAIPAAILIGLGFKPSFSALVSLIGNSVATSFGAVGVPVMTLAKEVYPQASSESLTPLTDHLAGEVIVQLAVMMFVVPFFILWLTDRRKESLISNIFLSLLVGSVSLIVQWASARFLGAETPAITGSIASIITLSIYSRVKQQRPHKRGEQKQFSQAIAHSLKAWAVYGLILCFVLLASSKVLSGYAVYKMYYPLAAKPLEFDWLGNAGLMIFLGTFIGGLIQGLSARDLLLVLLRTIFDLRRSAVSIISLVAMSSVMAYSGMIAVLAQALVESTGALYPIFAPLVGAIGTFATGSDTSSNILFGKLQARVATELGISKSWLAAANTAGATGGKIISPQSIAIATAACQMTGQEGRILRSALPYALFYVIIVGLCVYALMA